MLHNNRNEKREVLTTSWRLGLLAFAAFSVGCITIAHKASYMQKYYRSTSFYYSGAEREPPTNGTPYSNAAELRLTKPNVDAATQPAGAPRKLILAWTSYFSKRIEEAFRNDYLDRCGGHKECLISSNRSLLKNASAVMFHARDVNFKDMPEQRAPGQEWILLNLESPKHARITEAYDGIFNLTMTYRNDSDLPLPYGYFLKKDSTAAPPPGENPRLFRRKAAYWLVSNCEGRRMEYARELCKIIDVDIFGLCADGKRVPLLAAYELNLSSSYAFYLAFENSDCPQYITEKLWKTLKSPGGAIPVVLGPSVGDYEAAAPPGSFIHVDNFTSPFHLGQFLKKVMSSDDSFAYYHRWRSEYRAYSGDDKFMRAVCSLCERMHKPEARKTGTADMLARWFNRGCH